MIPDHAPFSPEQRRSLQTLITTLSPAQRFWLGGFLSAGAAAGSAAAPVAKAVAGPLTILYGSESGNSEKLAVLTGKEATKRGFKVKVVNMADVSPTILEKVENLLVIVSTWGDGEPPETATGFYKEMIATSLQLPKLRYSVCALGDTSYEKFCQTGKDVDAWLAKSGACAVVPRQDCDVSFKEPHQQWMKAALDALTPADLVGSSVEVVSEYGGFGEVAGVEYDRSNPFRATLAEKVLLNDVRSKKETWHYALSIENSGIVYQPGDALGVVPVNAPDVVERLLAASKLDASKIVKRGDAEVAIGEVLATDYDITALSRRVLEKIGEASPSKKLETLLSEEGKGALKDYLYGRWIEDAIRDFAPDGLAPAQLLALLREMPQRLYSIASSQSAFADEVHLTVASVRYEAHGLPRKGVASTYLADLVKVDDPVSVFVQENKNFRLPESGDTPIIMVGPGTGVAPFRSFVQHRAAQGATGKSWLFFGDQHYLHDFLYQIEWQDHLASGALNRLDVAFSRDQPEKVYVQHKMLERGAELYAWLKDGAHFYVCGDASRMASDVHEALVTIFEKHGHQSREHAEAEVEGLKKARRYQKDVY